MFSMLPLYSTPVTTNDADTLDEVLDSEEETVEAESRLEEKEDCGDETLPEKAEQCDRSIDVD